MSDRHQNLSDYNEFLLKKRFEFNKKRIFFCIYGFFYLLLLLYEHTGAHNVQGVGCGSAQGYQGEKPVQEVCG